METESEIHIDELEAIVRGAIVNEESVPMYNLKCNEDEIGNNDNLEDLILKHPTIAKIDSKELKSVNQKDKTSIPKTHNIIIQKQIL